MSEQDRPGSSSAFETAEEDLKRLNDIGVCYKRTCLGELLLKLNENPNDVVLRGALSVARIMTPLGLGINAVCGRSSGVAHVNRSEDGTPTEAIIEHCPEKPEGFIFTVDNAEPPQPSVQQTMPTPALPEEV